jgi:hypothetical protein
MTCSASHDFFALVWLIPIGENCNSKNYTMKRISDIAAVESASPGKITGEICTDNLPPGQKGKANLCKVIFPIL